MKETLTTSNPESESFTCSGNHDIKITGTFVGFVELQSQTSGETSWELVPDAVFTTPTQFVLNTNDTTIAYRFAAKLQSGSVVCYAGDVTAVA